MDGNAAFQNLTVAKYQNSWAKGELTGNPFSLIMFNLLSLEFQRMQAV